MESQLELEAERVKLVDKLRQTLPDLTTKEAAVTDGVYRDGALGHKVKRLIALGIALRAGCTNCILHHTIQALEVGATKDELLETISVEMAISGTSGIGESLRVVKILDELGKL
jgi:AhpD family alkylhydroperoxidase